MNRKQFRSKMTRGKREYIAADRREFWRNLFIARIVNQGKVLGPWIPKPTVILPSVDMFATIAEDT